MSHRELREDERCGMNTFMGVHVWEFSTEKLAGKDKGTQLAVACRLCKLKPHWQKRDRLLAEYEAQQARDAAAVRLHNLQRQATGTQLTRRAR